MPAQLPNGQVSEDEEAAICFARVNHSQACANVAARTFVVDILQPVQARHSASAKESVLVGRLCGALCDEMALHEKKGAL